MSNSSTEEFFTCVEADVPFYCAFCGKPIDPSVTEEGFVITSDDEVLHTECYFYTRFKKRLKQEVK